MVKAASRGGLVCLPAHSTQARGATASSRDDHLVRDGLLVRDVPSTIRGHVAPGAMASAQRESSTRRRLDHIPLPDHTFCASASVGLTTTAISVSRSLRRRSCTGELHNPWMFKDPVSRVNPPAVGQIPMYRDTSLIMNHHLLVQVRLPHSPYHSVPEALLCRVNSAHKRQLRPDPVLGFQGKVLETFQSVPSSLDRGERGPDCVPPRPF